MTVGRRWRRSLVLWLLALPLLAAAPPPDQPASRLDKPFWSRQFAQQKPLLARGRYDVILLGDSLTHELTLTGPQSWVDFRPLWQTWFACHRTIDLGFPGDTTANLLWRIENGGVPVAAPKAAVVLIGTNNNRPALGWTGTETASAIRVIVARLHDRYKATRIIVLGIPPNGYIGADTKIDAANAALAAMDWSGLNAVYVPTADLFETNGQLDTSLFREPHAGGRALHPDVAGWQKIAARLNPPLAQALGVPPGPCPAH